jgi:hypothetical protein
LSGWTQISTSDLLIDEYEEVDQAFVKLMGLITGLQLVWG